MVNIIFCRIFTLLHFILKIITNTSIKYSILYFMLHISFSLNFYSITIFDIFFTFLYFFKNSLLFLMLGSFFSGGIFVFVIIILQTCILCHLLYFSFLCIINKNQWELIFVTYGCCVNPNMFQEWTWSSKLSRKMENS